ncbi:DUF4097 family beta strand repeat-containing protein [Micromonospora sp. NPDC006766]|uniref:DUF4097 family beta strand repeat-containing protein n=1 Tax=Micromonospora sp. NPDC006766 TaxID=3154778 RepID=UPI0034056F86
MPQHRTAVAATAAAALILLSGCDPLSFSELTYDNTETVKITRIIVRPGSGDVTVHGSGSATDVRIKREVHYRGAQPDTAYRINGDELVLDTSCGNRCSVSWEVTVPEGVAVRGETGSGDITLSKVGAVDVTLGSGDVSVTTARGDVRAETGSGDITVDEVTGVVRLRASSGDVEARRLAAGVDAETSSGDVTVELDQPASARVHAGSGDVELTVPEGRYRVRTSTGSGTATVAVTDDPTAALLLDVRTGSGDIAINRR